MQIEIDGLVGEIEALAPSELFEGAYSVPLVGWYCVSRGISLRSCGHLCERYYVLSILKYCCLCAEKESSPGDLFFPDCQICDYKAEVAKGGN